MATTSVLETKNVRTKPTSNVIDFTGYKLARASSIEFDESHPKFLAWMDAQKLLAQRAERPLPRYVDLVQQYQVLILNGEAECAYRDALAVFPWNGAA